MPLGKILLSTEDLLHPSCFSPRGSFRSTHSASIVLQSGDPATEEAASQRDVSEPGAAAESVQRRMGGEGCRSA